LLFAGFCNSVASVLREEGQPQRGEAKKGMARREGVGFSTVAQSLLFAGYFFVGSSYGQWSEASGKEFFEFANEGIASQGSAGVSAAS